MSSTKKIAIWAGLLLFIGWVSIIIGLLTAPAQDDDSLIGPPDAPSTAPNTANNTDINNTENQLLSGILNNNQQVNSGDNSNDNTGSGQQALGQTGIQEITIAIPTHMISPGLREFFLRQEEANPGYYYTFITGDIYKDYYDTLSSERAANTVDIALIGSDVMVSYEYNAHQLTPQQDLKGFFHSMFHQYFAGNNTTVIPFAIDPLILLAAPKKNGLTTFTSISQVSEQYPNQEFLFGFDTTTLQLLKNNQQPYPGYFQGLYRLLAQWYTTNNTNDTKRFIDAQNSNRRDYITRRKQLTTKQKTNEHCQYYTHICFLSSNYGKASIGFLSDIVIRDRLFNKEIVGSQAIDLYNFPTLTQPARGRGRVINTNSSQLSQSIGITSAIIQESIQGNIRLLPNKMLSAFNNLYDLQLQQPIYQYIKQSRDKRKLIYGSRDWQDIFMNKTRIADVLLGTYNIELYFTKPARKF